VSDKAKNLLAILKSMDDTPQVRDDYVRGAFGYPGAKSRSIKELLSHLDYRKVWVDVMAGSGVVTLAREESRLEFFNDRCAGITVFFRCVRDPKKCSQLYERLQQTVCSREEFIWCRETWKHDVMDDVERAARWYYTVQHSFSSKGWSFGRVTHGLPQCGKLFNNISLFGPISNRLRKVYIENLDWRVLCKDLNTEKNGNDIVWYFDPPYWGTYKCYDHNFTEADHNELALRCMNLNGFVAVSGYDFPDHPYNKYDWTRKESWEIQTSMSGFAFTDTNHLEQYEGIMKRGKLLETLWIKDN
jgi:DNA adenine methylase